MLEQLAETYGDAAIGAAGGLALGVLFGCLARRSAFCMRSAVVDTVRGAGGSRLPLWLLALGTAIAGVQACLLAGLVQAETIRLINGSGSLSAAAFGGVLFGAGMVLARGCVSRLIVLSSGGNLRAVVTLLLFVGVAYATMKGPLAGARTAIAGLVPLDGALNLNLLAHSGLGNVAGAGFGLLVVAAALLLGIRRGLGAGRTLAGLGIGLAVAAAYAITAFVQSISFDPQPVRGLSFIAPAVNSVAAVLAPATVKPDFELLLVPGVLIGAFVTALLARDLRIEWFHTPLHALRHGAGAALMGFGGVLAGGCSMGNGLTGFAVFSTTAIVALGGMWLGAGLTDWLVDRPRAAPVAHEDLSALATAKA